MSSMKKMEVEGCIFGDLSFIDDFDSIHTASRCVSHASQGCVQPSCSGVEFYNNIAFLKLDLQLCNSRFPALTSRRSLRSRRALVELACSPEQEASSASKDPGGESTVRSQLESKGDTFSLRPLNSYCNCILAPSSRDVLLVLAPSQHSAACPCADNPGPQTEAPDPRHILWSSCVSKTCCFCCFEIGLLFI